MLGVPESGRFATRKARSQGRSRGDAAQGSTSGWGKGNTSIDAVDPKAILDDWLKRFELIENDIQEILLRRHVFLRLQEIVAEQPTSSSAQLLVRVLGWDICGDQCDHRAPARPPRR